MGKKTNVGKSILQILLYISSIFLVLCVFSSNFENNFQDFEPVCKESLSCGSALLGRHGVNNNFHIVDFIFFYEQCMKANLSQKYWQEDISILTHLKISCFFRDKEKLQFIDKNQFYSYSYFTEEWEPFVQ